MVQIAAKTREKGRRPCLDLLRPTTKHTHATLISCPILNGERSLTHHNEGRNPQDPQLRRRGLQDCLIRSSLEFSFPRVKLCTAECNTLPLDGLIHPFISSSDSFPRIEQPIDGLAGVPNPWRFVNSLFCGGSVPAKWYRRRNMCTERTCALPYLTANAMRNKTSSHSPSPWCRRLQPLVARYMLHAACMTMHQPPETAEEGANSNYCQPCAHSRRATSTSTTLRVPRIAPNMSRQAVERKSFRGRLTNAPEWLLQGSLQPGVVHGTSRAESWNDSSVALVGTKMTTKRQQLQDMKST
jgi:hypothetical protein